MSRETKKDIKHMNVELEPQKCLNLKDTTKTIRIMDIEYPIDGLRSWIALLTFLPICLSRFFYLLQGWSYTQWLSSFVQLPHTVV